MSIAEMIRDLVDYVDFSKSGVQREGNWEDCWADTLREFIESGYNVNRLFPRFIGASTYIRYRGEYTQLSEQMLFERYRDALLSYVPDGTEIIMELGAGSGHNTLYLAEQYPDKKVIGADWSKSSVAILNILSRRIPNISGVQIDLFNPQNDIPPNTTVFTFHAFEQLGDRFGNALYWLLRQKPKMVIQTEPIYEFYDESNPFDKVAMDYHKKRDYLTSYYTVLKALEDKGKIKIHEAKKSEFGSCFHDAYSLLVWEPL